MLYKIVGRRNDGAWMEKVTLDCDLDMAILVGRHMANSPRFEIYENGKDYFGDIRAKPIYKNYE
jgi:hypothetical protein